MTNLDFKNLVLQILNEADAEINGADMIGADMTKLSTYIENLYPFAWRRALKILPRSWFITKSFTDAGKVVNPPDGTGYVILPDDYLALSAFRMKGWRTDCLTAPEETPAINAKQKNEYLRGNVYEPVCVLKFISSDNTLKKALYYYSLPKAGDDTSHVIENALYIPNVTVLGDNVDIADNGIQALAYLMAATVLTTLEKDDAAKKIEARIIELI